jgi:hypothetical protein
MGEIVSISTTWSFPIGEGRCFENLVAWQLSATGSKDYATPEGIRVCPAIAFLRTLV